jgi:hypothetical protein
MVCQMVSAKGGNSCGPAPSQGPDLIVFDASLIVSLIEIVQVSNLESLFLVSRPPTLTQPALAVPHCFAGKFRLSRVPETNYNDLDSRKRQYGVTIAKKNKKKNSWVRMKTGCGFSTNLRACDPN